MEGAGRALEVAEWVSESAGRSSDEAGRGRGMEKDRQTENEAFLYIWSFYRSSFPEGPLPEKE